MKIKAVIPLLLLTAVVIACGARSEIPEPDVFAEGEGGGGGEPIGERACAPNCTIGHRCCIGGCDGPAAATVNDCCVCFDSEVDSSTCPGAVCGGGEACKVLGEVCEADVECCSQLCAYPSGFSEEKLCLVI